jgi:predicted secreted Zn-dependent protease
MPSYSFFALILLGAVQAIRQVASAVPRPSEAAERKMISEFAVLAIEHYEIRGETLEELNLEMRAKGQGGNAHTTGRINYDFVCQGSGGLYAIKPTGSTCIAKIRMPRWYGVERASTSDKAVWKTYYDKLLGHEMGHVAICADTAKKVLNALESMPTAPTCDGIYQDARRRATKIIESMQSRQEKYDGDSDSGRREY